MKTKIKNILNTITPQDLENGCERQVEELNRIFIEYLEVVNIANTKVCRNKKISLITAIDFIIGGYLWKNGEIEDLPEIFYNFYKDYNKEIKDAKRETK